MKLTFDDAAFCIIIIMAIAAIFMIGGEQTEIAIEAGAGAVNVDLDLIQQKIDSGELSSREAEFYSPVQPGKE
jgi:hypothetical protein